MSIATAPVTVDEQAPPALPVEMRDPPPGVSLWMRGDGAFSIRYAPPLQDHLTMEEMFAQMRTWLDEREASFRRFGDKGRPTHPGGMD